MSDSESASNNTVYCHIYGTYIPRLTTPIIVIDRFSANAMAILVDRRSFVAGTCADARLTRVSGSTLDVRRVV